MGKSGEFGPAGMEARGWWLGRTQRPIRVQSEDSLKTDSVRGTGAKIFMHKFFT